MAPPQGLQAASADAALARLAPLLEQLEQVLEHEMRALGDGDRPRLDALVTHKRTLLQDVDRVCREPVLASLLAGVDGNGALPDPLHQRLRRCRALNEAIGGAVVAAMRHNEQTLQLLGHTGAPVTYGRDSARVAVQGRTLATA